MGCIFKKRWKDKKTEKVVEYDTLWIKYFRNGKPYYESCHSTREAVAKKLLRLREGEISKGEIPGIHFDKVTFDDLAKDFLRDYRINKRRTVNRATCLVKHLKKSFEGTKAVDIDTSMIEAHKEKRMLAGLSNATINRELSALKRMFSLASQCMPPKIRQMPYISMLEESNTREGFFEYDEYLAVKDALPSYLKPVITFAYHTGWRLSEIVGLTWNKVDLKEGIVRLETGETKNKQARSIYLDGELLKEMKALHGGLRLVAAKGNPSETRPSCPYVFHREGERIQSFGKAWKTACIKAGLFEVKKDAEGNPVVVKDKHGIEVKDEAGNAVTVKVPTKIFHDFRRTGVRNMVRAGVPERVAMKRSGHKTRSVFDRYNIVSDADDKEAAAKMETYLNSQAQPEKVTVPVTVERKVVNLDL